MKKILLIEKSCRNFGKSLQVENISVLSYLCPFYDLIYKERYLFYECVIRIMVNICRVLILCIVADIRKLNIRHNNE